MKSYSALILVALMMLGACNKKESDSVIAPSELAPFVGTWGTCHAVSGKGTDFPNGGASYLMQLVINANGTFTHGRWYYGDSATCTGVENVVSWSESGNVSVIRDSSNVSGAKEISFDRTSSYVTARNINGKLFFDHFKIVFNPFTNAAGSSATVSDPTGIYLNNSATVVMGDFEINNGITYNTVSVSGTTMSMKDPLDWHMGQISAPASQDFNLTKQ